MQIDPQAAQIYAQALFNLALERGQLDPIDADVRAIEGLLATSQGTRLRQFLESPKPLLDDQLRAVDHVFGGRVAPMLVNVVKMMLRKQRILVLGETLETLRRRIDEHRGLKPGLVVTARPLDAAQQRELQARLEQVTGLRFAMEFRVQPAMLGGVLFKAGDMLIDATLRHQLSLLRERLTRIKLPTSLAAS